MPEDEKGGNRERVGPRPVVVLKTRRFAWRAEHRRPRRRTSGGRTGLGLMPARRRNVSREITFSNPDKIYYPDTQTTKAEVIRYYLEVAPWILPHLKDRPVTLIRFPDGVGGKSFYEKNAPGHTPEWVQRFQVPRRRHEGVIDYILINDAETLAWCANLAALELHPFLHRAPNLHRPTHIAFDLDPGEGASLLTCIEVAFLLRELLEGLGLQAWPKVSGSKGLQIYVPLHTDVTYEATQPFAKAVAELLERQHPKLIVSNMAKAKRKNRVLIDWSQNSEAKTTVCVYSLRGKRGAPYVSMAVSWEELARVAKRRNVEGLQFTPLQALARLRKHGDLFAPVLTERQSLPDAFTDRGRVAAAGRARPAKTGGGDPLREYATKRDFGVTAEPKPARPRRSRQGGQRRFVIQKHAASHLHYDFRLEIDDTLKSWAVPKGLPYELKVKRSAFETEDHPLDYLDFEGTIPAGQYGGGTVMVWDIGTYDLISGDHAKGSLHVYLNGEKLKGHWNIYRIRREEEKNVWLVEKRDEAHPPISARRDDQSVLTKRTMKRIAADNDAQWQSHRGSDGAATTEAPARAARAKKKPARSRPTGRVGGKKPAGEPLQFVEPMVAEPVTQLPEGDEWMYEVKWDGFRTLGLKEGERVRLLSRRNRDMSGDFPTILAAVQELPVERALVDGELVALDEDGRPSFQALQNRSSRSPRVIYYAFDLLQLDEEDLKAEPLEVRREHLESLVAGTGVRLSAELAGSAVDVVTAVRKLGLEGVMAKRRDAPYQPGERSAAWKKMRLALEQEFVIGGFRPGLGSFDSVLVGYYEGSKLLFAGKVRAGFNRRNRAEMAARLEPDWVAKCPFANLPDERHGRWGEGVTAEDMKSLQWIKPRHVIQVDFVEWTDRGRLRHPAYKGLREDKRPRDVRKET
jgi:bifunctional non-homologous end joining protein LigD